MIIIFTYNLSVSTGKFLGTCINPRWEQSIVVPMQEHPLGHLDNVEPKPMSLAPLAGSPDVKTPRAKAASATKTKENRMVNTFSPALVERPSRC